MPEIYAKEDMVTSTPRREGRRGFTIWMTGLSGSGKSTLAERLVPVLYERGLDVELLDGDVIRTHLSKGLGFSKEDRDTNILRIGWVAERMSHHGVAVIASAISPYRETRDRVRATMPDRFVEVFVSCPVEECARRDTKGLYERALRGEIVHRLEEGLGLHDHSGATTVRDVVDRPVLVMRVVTEIDRPVFDQPRLGGAGGNRESERSREEVRKDRDEVDAHRYSSSSPAGGSTTSRAPSTSTSTTMCSRKGIMISPESVRTSRRSAGFIS